MHHSFTNTRMLVFASLGLFVALGASGQELPGGSSDIHLNAGGSVLADHEAFFGLSGPLASVDLGDLPENVDLDALHSLPNGHVLFSLDTTATLGSLVVSPADVVRFDGATYIRYFDSLAAGHLTLVPALRDALAQLGRGDILIVVGGVVPPEDVPTLRNMGVVEVFGPGTRVTSAASSVVHAIAHSLEMELGGSGGAA